MDFTHYREGGAVVAADLVNSRGSTSGREYLPDPAALESFLAEHGLEAPTAITMKDVEEVRSLRDRLREVFEAPDEEATARLLNGILAGAATLPKVVRDAKDGGEAWRLRYVPARQSVATRLSVLCAMGLATLMCELGHERLGVCTAAECRDVFVDTSRNRSRRYCNSTCSSRMNVAAYRARHKDHT